MASALASPLRLRAARMGAWASVVLVLTAGAGAGTLSYLAADRLVHPPRDLNPATPAWRGMAYEDATLLTEDGLRLAAWWMPAEGEALGAVVFLHGYGASKAQSLAVAPFLHRAGYHVLAPDLRGHGWSEGGHTTFGIDEAADARAAYSWLAQRGDVDMARVAFFGWSMGGATALLASESMPDVKAFVVDSAFARLDNVVSNSLSSLTGLPPFPFSPLTIGFASLMTHRQVGDSQPARATDDLARPVLIIHGQADHLVRPDVDAIELQQAAGERGELWLVPDADHVNARRYHPMEYQDRVLSFLAKHLAPEAEMQGPPLPPPTA